MTGLSSIIGDMAVAQQPTIASYPHEDGHLDGLQKTATEHGRTRVLADRVITAPGVVGSPQLMARLYPVPPIIAYVDEPEPTELSDTVS